MQFLRILLNSVDHLQEQVLREVLLNDLENLYSGLSKVFGEFVYAVKSFLRALQFTQIMCGHLE
jgi:hypothetical protein